MVLADDLAAIDSVLRKWIIHKTDLVLITGANGFVGSKVLEILVEYGFKRIRCLVRSDRNLSALRLVARAAANIEILRGNLLSRDDCAAAVENVSLILHLAAGTGKSFAGCFMDSALATRNLLDSAVDQVTLKRFVNVSSLAVYSGYRARRGSILDEACPIEHDHMERYDPYCYGKIKQDELVKAYGRKQGLLYTIVRPGPVFGPGKRALTGRVGIDSFGVFIHVAGSNRIPLTYIDNCAEAIVLAGLVGGLEGETLIVVDDDLPTSRQFLRDYKRQVGWLFSFHMPYPIFYLFCWLWEKYSRWSAGQLPPFLNRRRCAADYQKRIYSNRKLKNLTGWRPRVPFPEASRRYFAFMRNGDLSQ